MNPKYRQLRHGIFLVIFILGGGIVRGGDKARISVALLQGFESRSGTPGFELSEQLEKIHSQFKDKLEISKATKVQVIPVPMREIASADENVFPDVIKETKTYLEIARNYEALAVIKGFYTLTEDLFVLTFRVCDAKIGAFFTVSLSAKSEQGKIQMNEIKQNLDRICKEIVERIIYYNNLSRINRK